MNTMIQKVLILLGLAACVLGDLPAISEQKFIVHHKKISHDDHNHDGHGLDHGHHDPGHDDHGHIDHGHDDHGHDDHGHDDHGHDDHGHDHHGHDDHGHDDHSHGDHGLNDHGHDKLEHHDKYEWSYPSYEFAYKVDDPHTGDHKGHEETRDGDEVKGQYWLMQPDGRKRIVKYYADKKSGFKADVIYVDPSEHKGDDEKSHHISHYSKEEQKIEHDDHKDHDHEDHNDKGGYEVEDHGEKGMKMDDEKHGDPSEELPFMEIFKPIPYKRPNYFGRMRDSYYMKKAF